MQMGGNKEKEPADDEITLLVSAIAFWIVYAIFWIVYVIYFVF